jgi:hypothetical protein
VTESSEVKERERECEKRLESSNSFGLSVEAG